MSNIEVNKIIDPIPAKDIKRLGWVDEALEKEGYKRQITVFTRHYQSAVLMAQQKGLIATVPTRAATAQSDNPRLIIKNPPFHIPDFELKMAWSPLLQHNVAHQWLRNLIAEVAAT